MIVPLLRHRTPLDAPRDSAQLGIEVRLQQPENLPHNLPSADYPILLGLKIEERTGAFRPAHPSASILPLASIASPGTANFADLVSYSFV